MQALPGGCLSRSLRWRQLDTRPGKTTRRVRVRCVEPTRACALPMISGATAACSSAARSRAVGKAGSMFLKRVLLASDLCTARNLHACIGDADFNCVRSRRNVPLKTKSTSACLFFIERGKRRRKEKKERGQRTVAAIASYGTEQARGNLATSRRLHVLDCLVSAPGS
jgi:hypothetical protein